MNIKEMNRNKTFFGIFVILVYCFYFYLAYNTPLSQDDWTWGSSVGLEIYRTIDGRYVGNGFAIIFTRFDWLRFFAMALFSTSLVVLVGKQAKKDSYFPYILGLLLLLSIPVNIVQQTYAWISGYFNYMTSTVFLLMYITLIKNIFEAEKPVYPKWMTIAVIPLGIVSQLIMENITIFIVFLAFCVVIYTAVKFRKVYSLHIAYLVSTVVGAIIMFSNSAYRTIAAGDDGRRTIGAVDEVGFFEGIFNTYTDSVHPLLFAGNTLLNIIISIFCIILIVKHKKVSTKLNNVLKFFLLIVLVIYPLYTPLVDKFGITGLENTANTIGAIISIIFFLSVLLTVVVFTEDKAFRQRVSFFWLSAVIIAAPFLVITPFGPRNILTSYAFFTIVAVELGAYIIEKGYFQLSALNKLFTILVLFISGLYIYVFTMNGMVDRQRIDYIQEQVEAGKDTIVVIRLPYEQFHWRSVPNVPSFQYHTFKLFHGIPEESELKMISYEEWRENNAH